MTYENTLLTAFDSFLSKGEGCETIIKSINRIETLARLRREETGTPVTLGVKFGTLVYTKENFQIDLSLPTTSKGNRELLMELMQEAIDNPDSMEIILN